jgi:stage II sporulation protein D
MLLVAASALTAPVAAADPPAGATAIGDSTRFHGRGYGHGVGMSQHGARGRATDGQTAEQILAHYYQGATLGTIPVGTPIRVRVLVDAPASTANPLVLIGRGGTWTIDGIATSFPADARAEVRPTASTVDGATSVTWRLRVIAPGGSVLHDAPTSHFRMRPWGTPRQLRTRGFASPTLVQVPGRSSSNDTYRGVIRAVLSTTSTRANVVNEVSLETYLRGVVPAEMPSSWPREALRAQSIAARSFAARRLRPGVSWYDVADDTTSQVYLGVEGEKAATDTAISDTAGTVLMSGSAIANTLFHSAGGGATEHNENVYVSSTGVKVASPVSYLRGVADRRDDGSTYDSTSPYATWATDTYTRTALSGIFAGDSRTNVGTLAALDLRARGVSGRLIRVTLYGSLGSKTVSGDVFRSVFNARRPSGDSSMRSTLVDTSPVP